MWRENNNTGKWNEKKSGFKEAWNEGTNSNGGIKSGKIKLYALYKNKCLFFNFYCFQMG